MERMQRSFQLVGQSYRVLMQDTELMLLPLMSGIVMAIVVAAAAFGVGIDGLDTRAATPQVYVPLFALYVVLYAVGIFFQCAVIAGATERMRGGNPTLGSALSAASRRLVPILLWACAAATIGMALKAIQDRAGFVGKIVVGLLGAAWSLATFFVAPVLVLEDAYIGDVLGRSVELFKQTWGETFVGGASLGIASFAAWMTLVAVTGLMAWAVGTPAIIFFVPCAILLLIFFSALQGVYLASLYRYATDGVAPDGFDRHLLASAFVDKDRR